MVRNSLCRYASFLLCAVLSLCSCSNSCTENYVQESQYSQQLTVVNWNVQTFFDAQNEGCEYAEFLKSKKWGQSAYTSRVERLCSVIKALDADVFVMEEVENDGILHDVSNFLAGEWNSRKVYAYGAFAKDEGSGIGCAVLSRWPLQDFTVHEFTVRGLNGSAAEVPATRPLMELTVNKNGRNLVLFVSHWKSMSGGEEITEQWRIRQEAVLARRAALCESCGKAYLCLGDFNRSVEKFCVEGSDDYGGVVQLRGIEGGAVVPQVTVHSPWYRASGSLVKPGSYYFRGEWSRIDNVFVGGGAVSLAFAPCTGGPWCDEETGVPVRYILNTGTGYSDHLPVKVEVSF